MNATRTALALLLLLASACGAQSGSSRQAPAPGVRPDPRPGVVQPERDLGRPTERPTGAALVVAAPVTVPEYQRHDVSAAEFGAVGDGVTDDTAALKAALAALPGGGVLFIPLGKYRITDALPLHSGLTIQGASNADWNYGELPGAERKATYIFQTTAGLPVFSVGGSVRDLVIQNLALGPVESPRAGSEYTPGAIGIRMRGAYPQSSSRIRLDRVTFYNFERAITAEDAASPVTIPWQIDGFQLNQCVFFNNHIGVYFDTINADYWKFDTCGWFVPSNGFGVYARSVGFISFDNCAGGGTGFGPDGGTFLYLDGFWDLVKITGSQMEKLANFVHVGPSAAASTDSNRFTISMIGSISECGNRIERAAKLTSYWSRYSHDVVVTGRDVVVDSYADTFVLPWDPGSVATVAVASISGSGTLVTVTSPSHGLDEMSRVDVRGASDPEFDALDAQVVVLDADRFQYYAPGVGTLAASPTIYRLPRFVVPPGGSSEVRTYPPIRRKLPGDPKNAMTPAFVGEEVFDTVGRRWYRSISRTGTGWTPLN